MNKAFAPISEMEVDNSQVPTSSIPIAVSIATPQPTTTSGGEEKRTLSLALTPSLQSMLAQGKMITSNALQTLKTSGGISLLTNTPVSPTKSTIITVPSASAASLLVSKNTGLRTTTGKMIQLVTKSGSPLISSSKNLVKEKTPQPPQSNLSLLSDVAGMSQHMSSSSKKLEGVSSTATLVKLGTSTSDKPSPFQSMKCLKVIKAVRTPSPPTRIETAEELVEKQLAIQALNKSIGIESSSNLVKESGYSICYAKADGSIVSRSVTRPNYSGLVPHMSAAQNRGRGRPPFHNKTFRFSNK